MTEPVCEPRHSHSGAHSNHFFFFFFFFSPLSSSLFILSFLIRVINPLSSLPYLQPGSSFRGVNKYKTCPWLKGRHVFRKTVRHSDTDHFALDCIVSDCTRQDFLLYCTVLYCTVQNKIHMLMYFAPRYLTWHTCGRYLLNSRNQPNIIIIINYLSRNYLFFFFVKTMFR